MGDTNKEIAFGDSKATLNKITFFVLSHTIFIIGKSVIPKSEVNIIFQQKYDTPFSLTFDFLRKYWKHLIDFYSYFCTYKYLSVEVVFVVSG